MFKCSNVVVEVLPADPDKLLTLHSGELDAYGMDDQDGKTETQKTRLAKSISLMHLPS